MQEDVFVPAWTCKHCGASEYQPLHRGDCPNATREDSFNAVLEEEALDTETGKALSADERLREEVNAAIDRVGRYFESGAYRDTDIGKNDYEGFLSPAVIRRFGDYMTKHRQQSDGTMRDSDNWQKGIPQDQYMKSMWRHFLDVWTIHRSGGEMSDIEEPLCALLFNVMGYLHEELKK